MRINKYLALSSGLSRRSVDKLIEAKKILVNGKLATLGQQVEAEDEVKLNNQIQILPEVFTTIILNKPRGYVVTRISQDDTPTIYKLIDPKYHNLKPVGRLDKDSSGLLLLTNDGDLANKLTHPSNLKIKVYLVTLDKNLEPIHQQMISDYGIKLEDGISKLRVAKLEDSKHLEIRMSEGRNRQIRRTFEALGYKVLDLHRTAFGEYSLQNIKEGQYIEVEN